MDQFIYLILPFCCNDDVQHIFTENFNHLFCVYQFIYLIPPLKCNANAHHIFFDYSKHFHYGCISFSIWYDRNIAIVMYNNQAIDLKSRVFANGAGVQSYVELYQRLKKWYLMPPCLTLSITKYGSMVKWNNPGIGAAHSTTPRFSCYWKGSLRVTLDKGRQLFFTHYFGGIHLSIYVTPYPHRTVVMYILSNNFYLFYFLWISLYIWF